MLKRGQAAMEFLMTYGWAIIAVLISIGALAYFGVLSPSLFLPESCTLFPGIACIETQAAPYELSLRVRNGLGSALNPFTITTTDCGSGVANNGLSDGEEEIIVIHDCNLANKNSIKQDLTVTYTKDGVSHTRVGKLSSIIGENYARNGDFESDQDNDNLPDKWSIYSGHNSDPPYVDRAIYKTGKASMHFSSAAGLPGSVIMPNILTSQYIPVSPGQTIKVSAFFKANNIVVGPEQGYYKLYLAARWYDSSFAILGSNCCLDISPPTGTYDWTLYQATEAVPAGAVYFNIFWVGLAGSGSGEGWVDGLKVEFV